MARVLAAWRRCSACSIVALRTCAWTILIMGLEADAWRASSIVCRLRNRLVRLRRRFFTAGSASMQYRNKGCREDVILLGEDGAEIDDQTIGLDTRNHRD